MDIRYAFGRDCDFIHREIEEIADAAAEAAVEDEAVFDILKFVVYKGFEHFLEFGGAQEERLVVHDMHQGFAFLGGESSEWRFRYFVGVFKFVEKGFEGFHFVDHGVV